MSKNRIKPAKLLGKGRPQKSSDKSDITRSDKFHAESKNEVAAVARWYARNYNSYTYEQIGKCSALTKLGASI